MKTTILILGLGIATSSLSLNANAQSFNCNQRGMNLTEHAICQSASLSYKDEEMARLWGLLTKRDRRAMRAGQRGWIGRRNLCGSNHGCIGRKYDARIVDLLETMDVN